MAKQRGLIRVKGSIGDTTYYKSQDGWLARERTEFDHQKLATHPNYQRVRENLKEFSGAAKSGKLLRESIEEILVFGRDRRTTSRVTKLMTQIKNLHTSTIRGSRNVAGGITDPQAAAMLKGFNFNAEAPLSTILYRPYEVDTQTGEVTFTEFIPMNHVAAPTEATHVNLQSCWARIDFSTGEFERYYSDEQAVAIDMTSSDIALTPSGTPAGTGTDFFFLKVGFSQQMGANLYPLRNRSYNALALIDLV